MAKKKTDETGEAVDAVETQATEGGAEENAAAPAEERSKGAAKAASESAEGEGTSVVDTVIDTAASAVNAVTNVVSEGAAKLSEVISGDSSKPASRGKRAERIGVVASDKMTKTVVVRVDRLIKHPVYRKYVRKRKKFMAHDELGSKVGDKVRIIETRPLSARKRWRVVEIIQKAEL